MELDTKTQVMVHSSSSVIQLKMEPRSSRRINTQHQLPLHSPRAAAHSSDS